MCFALRMIILQLFFDFLHQGFWDFLDMCSAFSAAWKKNLLNTNCVDRYTEREYDKEKSIFDLM